MRKDFKALLKPEHFAGLEALAAEANNRDVSMASLAMAWVLHHPDVAMVNIGPSRRPPYLGHVKLALSIDMDNNSLDRLTSFFSR